MSRLYVWCVLCFGLACLFCLSLAFLCDYSVFRLVVVAGLGFGGRVVLWGFKRPILCLVLMWLCETECPPTLGGIGEVGVRVNFLPFSY